VYKSLVQYLGFNVLVLLLGFLLLPLLSNVIDPSEYGKVGIYLAIVALIQPFIGMSSESLVQVKKHRLNDKGYNGFVSNIYFVSLLCFFVSVLFLQCYYGFDAKYSSEVLLLVSFIGLTRFLINVRLMEYTIEGKAVLFGLARFGVKFSAVLILTGCLFFSYSPDNKLYMLILLVSELSVIVFFVSERAGLLIRSWNVSLASIKEIFKFGLPIMLSTLPLWVLNEYGKFALQGVSLSAVGYFVFAKQLSMVYVQVCASVANAFVSRVLGESSKRALFKIFIISTSAYALLLILYVIFFSLLSDIVVGDRFSDSIELFHILLAGSFCQVLATIPSQLIAREGKTRFLLISAVLSSLVFLFLSHIYFQEISAVNIAFSFVFGMAAYACFMWFFTLIGIIRYEFSD